MLTKIGNLSGLQNLKQSQLNLGVVQSLVGEVLNTDNCLTILNAYGVAFRFHTGIQICVATGLTLAYSGPEYLDCVWQFPAAFTNVMYANMANMLSGITGDYGGSAVNKTLGKSVNEVGSSPSTTSTSFYLRAAAGFQFSSGDYIRSRRAVAIGLWK